MTGQVSFAGVGDARECRGSMAEKLSAEGVYNCRCRQLYRYLSFYRTYHQIVGQRHYNFGGLCAMFKLNRIV